MKYAAFAILTCFVAAVPISGAEARDHGVITYGTHRNDGPRDWDRRGIAHWETRGIRRDYERDHDQDELWVWGLVGEALLNDDRYDRWDDRWDNRWDRRDFRHDEDRRYRDRRGFYADERRWYGNDRYTGHHYRHGGEHRNHDNYHARGDRRDHHPRGHDRW